MISCLKYIFFSDCILIHITFNYFCFIQHFKCKLISSASFLNKKYLSICSFPQKTFNCILTVIIWDILIINIWYNAFVIRKKIVEIFVITLKSLHVCFFDSLKFFLLKLLFKISNELFIVWFFKCHFIVIIS